MQVILVWEHADGTVERDPPAESDQLGFALEPRSDPIVVPRDGKQWAIVAVKPAADGQREIVLREQA